MFGFLSLKALRHESEKNHRNDKLKMRSKVASIKKLLNKKIKLNTKIVFDDEGEVSTAGKRFKNFNIFEETKVYC